MSHHYEFFSSSSSYYSSPKTFYFNFLLFLINFRSKKIRLIFINIFFMIITSSEWRGGNFQQNSIALPHSFDIISHKSRECERILVYMYLIFLKKLLTIFFHPFFFLSIFSFFYYYYFIFSLEWITWVFSFNSVILSSQESS